MNTLVILYWIKIALGIIAASLSTAVAILLNEPSFTTFFNGLTVALLVYLISYYVLKAAFLNKVEKASKIMSTGVFMYFITWAVFFILFYTLYRQPV